MTGNRMSAQDVLNLVKTKKLDPQQAALKLKELARQTSKEGNSQDIESVQDRSEEAEYHLKACFERVLQRKLTADDLDKSFSELGVDSITLVKLVEAINKALSIKLKPNRMFDYPSIKALAPYVADQVDLPIFQETSRDTGGTSVVSQQSRDIAVIGMSGRFPGADNVNEFWDMLASGTGKIGEVPPDRWSIEEFFDADHSIENRSYSRWGAFLDKIDQFDERFFNISGKEAKLTDPQQRLFLEQAWEAMEDAGYASHRIGNRRCGVFAGVGNGDYQTQMHQANVSHAAQAFMGNENAILASRVAYLLDLKGPCLAVDTACSSSLVAVHLACQSIWSGESDYALAGGVFIRTLPDFFIYASKAGMLSPTGGSYAFDARADGFTPGEGVGVIMLKPLDQAIADRDNIHGVIKGSATNQDGRTNGITAPSVKSQAELQKGLYQRFGILPGSINYVETHGTGTKLGDPIEIDALSQSYGAQGESGMCPIGSVKTNIGHTVTAAGIAGVLKVLMSLKHKALPPSLNFVRANPEIDFDSTPFYVNTTLAPWHPQNNAVRRAAISSFGFSGTNAHVVIDEAPSRSPADSPLVNKPQMISLSARTDTGLMTAIRNLHQWLEDNGDQNRLIDIAYTLMVGRQHFKKRLGMVVNSVPELRQKLSECLESGQLKAITPDGVSSFDVALKGAQQGENVQAMMEEQLRLLVENTETDDEGGLVRLQWLAACFEQGHDSTAWEHWYETGGACTISLPTYPFERKRHWYDQLPATRSEGRIEASAIPSTAPAPAPAPAPENSTATKPMFDNQSAEVSVEINALGIALVKMHDRVNRNMLTDKLLAGLRHIFQQINQSNNVKVVVLTGYDNVFCMGGTAEMLNDLSENKGTFADNPFVYRGLLDCKVPVISAIQGHASGGGLAFGLYGDIVILAEQGVYSANFTKYGFTPGMGATLILKRRFGENLSARMMYTANSYRGEELRSMAPELLYFSTEKVLPEAIAIATQIADKPQLTLETLKKGLTREINAQLPDVIALELEMHRQTFSQPEVKARLQAHFESLKKFNQGRVQQPLRVSTQVSTSPIITSNKESSYKELSYREDHSDVRSHHPQPAEDYLSVSFGGDKDQLSKQLGEILERIIQVQINDDDLYENFHALGMDSINGVEIIRDINKTLQTQLEVTALYDYPTLDKLAEHLLHSVSPKERNNSKETVDQKNLIAEPKAGSRSGDLHGFIEQIRAIVSRILHENISQEDLEENFSSLGVDSISGVEIIRDLNKHLNATLEVTSLYDYPSISKLAQHVLDVVPPAPIEIDVEPPVKVEAAAVEKPVEYKSETLNRESTATEFVAVRASSNTGTIRLRGKRKKGDTILIDETPKASRVRLRPTGKAASPEQSIDPFQAPKQDSNDIAIIGMSGRFPGANNIEEFWGNLASGTASITEIPFSRWDYRETFSSDTNADGRSYSKWGGFINSPGQFDHQFFNVSPLEGEIMDPQQRLFLQEAYKTFEDAGYSDTDLAGSRCGIYVGATFSDYDEVLTSASLDRTSHAFTGLAPSILAARMAYHLNLKGPCLAIDTACSSSLVAVHSGCQSILNGDCDMALAGGVYMMYSPRMHIQGSQSNMLSPTGKCRPFGAGADGIVVSEGVGVVLLKRLTQAIADNDHIYGVIKGSGVNQDGATNGITAPSVNAQRQLEIDVYNKSGIDPDTISLVEAHGTGTALGDPVEINALRKAFAEFTSRRHFCAIGSVKGNVGHTTMAAGITSLIKVLLSFAHQQIPPSLNAEEENEHLNLDDSPFYINKTLKDWPANNDQKRRAAISSFGFSGTNSHVVVEEAPSKRQSKSRQGRAQIIPLSARNETALMQKMKDLFHWLEQSSVETNLEDIAYTLQIGRSHFALRRVLVVSSLDELKETLLLMINDGRTGATETSAKPQQTRTLPSELEKADHAGKIEGFVNHYLSGHLPQWSALYGNEQCHRVPLPTYPFTTRELWPSAPKDRKAQKEKVQKEMQQPPATESTQAVQNVPSEKSITTAALLADL
ncbi:hypothetical protein BTA51_26150 [Hahella sp. CCB-MM4]|uniref:beta-ketoacyl synthase N-terminal-like domain-containing protein n=1 Tax=Hahella sp. (strain CCB-MM4) TaxID=1926491 RepID=UPI000B9AE596|nr:beta-ketoacyl synthase N-terminal-like domain-containing protein [Hahella sp. CCB-MM4]OZG70453.1 hypothetical protein BTA51_26150 [Hahella sp. CCB-MM4]